MQRCYYHNSNEGFVSEPQYEILGKLTQNHGFDLNDLQRNAWLAQINEPTRLFRRQFILSHATLVDSSNRR